MRIAAAASAAAAVSYVRRSFRDVGLHFPHSVKIASFLNAGRSTLKHSLHNQHAPTALHQATRGAALCSPAEWVRVFFGTPIASLVFMWTTTRAGKWTLYLTNMLQTHKTESSARNLIIWRLKYGIGSKYMSSTSDMAFDIDELVRTILCVGISMIFLDYHHTRSSPHTMWICVLLARNVFTSQYTLYNMYSIYNCWIGFV